MSFMANPTVGGCRLVRVVYELNPEGWSMTSPDVTNWTGGIGGDSYEEAMAFAREGLEWFIGEPLTILHLTAPNQRTSNE